MMLRIPLVLSLCACAVIATYTPGQNPLPKQRPPNDTTMKEAASAVKAIDDLINEWRPKLRDRRSLITKVGAGNDKMQQYLLVFDDISRDLTETSYQLQLLHLIESVDKRTEGLLLASGILEARLGEYDRKFLFMEAMRAQFQHPKSTESPNPENDVLLDVAELLETMRDEFLPHVKKLRRLQMPNPPPAGARVG